MSTSSYAAGDTRVVDASEGWLAFREKRTGGGGEEGESSQDREKTGNDGAREYIKEQKRDPWGRREVAGTDGRATARGAR